MRVAPWLRLFRVRLLPTALSNLLVGYILEGGAVQSSRVVLPLVLAGLLFAWGMGLNDYFDRDWDRHRYADRPLPSGSISVRAARSALFVLFLLAVVTGIAIGESAALWTAVVLFLIAIYDRWAKRLQSIAPLLMGAIRAGLVCLGAASATGSVFGTEKVAIASLVIGVYVLLVTFYSQEEERASPRALRMRSAWVSVWAASAVFWPLLGDRSLDSMSSFSMLERTVAWAIVLVWVHVHARRAIEGGSARPHVATFRYLLGLHLLDMLLLVSYDFVLLSGIPCVLWLISWRPWSAQSSITKRTET